MPHYLTPKKDDYNQIPELQVCIAEALYDIESILSDPERRACDRTASGVDVPLA